MSTLVSQSPDLSSTVSIDADDFAALEQRVLRTIDLLKTERAARSAAESRADELHHSLESQTADLLRVEAEAEALKKDRDAVRGRVERMLSQLDELAS